MPSGSLSRLHRPRHTGRTALRLLATLILALALAEPAVAQSFGAEEVDEMTSMMAQEGVTVPPEVTIPEVSVPEVPVDAPAPVEAAPVEPAPVEPAPPPPPPEVVEADPAPVAETAPAGPPEPPAPPVEAAPRTKQAVPPKPPPAPPEPAATPPPPVPLGADSVEEDAELALDEIMAAVQPEEEASSELPVSLDEPDASLPEEDEPAAPVVPINLNVDIRIFSPGDDGDVNQLINMPTGGGGGAMPVGGLDDLGLDWTWNWNWVWSCGGASTAGMNWNWNWTWDDACLPQDLGSELVGGDRPADGHLDGLLETLVPEGTSLAEAVGDVDDTPDARPAPAPVKRARAPRPQTHQRKPSRTHVLQPVLSSPGLPPSDGGGLTTLALSPSSGAEGTQARTAMPAGGAAGPEPARDPADEPPHSLALAGLAPAGGGGGGGGGGIMFLLLAAVLAALVLVPSLAGGRVQALHRKLSSLLSSSRLERPG